MPVRLRPGGRAVHFYMLGSARLWHPWLRIQRVLRLMLTSHWSAAESNQIKPEIKKAMAETSRIQGAGWFNRRIVEARRT